MAPNASSHIDSPGNAHNPPGIAVPPMRVPHFVFVYRIIADMVSHSWSILNSQGAGITGIFLPIKAGTVSGPKISGTIVPNSGADWLERINSLKVRGNPYIY